MIANTEREADQFGKQGVSMNMNATERVSGEKLTSKELQKEQGFIAIVMDNTVYSAPQVNEAITGGSSRILGSFTIEDAQDFNKNIRSRNLPATAEIVQSEVVGPSLGQEAIDNGLISFVLGFSLVLLWMVVYLW